MENSSKVVARLPKKKFLTKERLFILCSLAPTLIMLSGWTFYPTLHSFVLSFFDTTMDSLGEFEGLRNYVAVLTNETFWVALRNTALFSLESIAGAVTSGLLLAVLLNTRMSGKRLFRTAFFLPYVIPPRGALDFVDVAVRPALWAVELSARLCGPGADSLGQVFGVGAARVCHHEHLEAHRLYHGAVHRRPADHSRRPV